MGLRRGLCVLEKREISWPCREWNPSVVTVPTEVSRLPIRIESIKLYRLVQTKLDELLARFSSRYVVTYQELAVYRMSLLSCPRAWLVFRTESLSSPGLPVTATILRIHTYVT